jgi:acyl-CoA thioester hydrolase
MQQKISPPWSLQRTVLPQHTDHAGVMWHGAYVAWLEESRVLALEAVGLAYSDLSERGMEMPLVSLAIEYRRPLRHGDRVSLLSWVEPRQGVRLRWRSRFLRSGDGLAAEATVILTVVDHSEPESPRVLRRWPDDLERATAALIKGPDEPAGV